MKHKLIEDDLDDPDPKRQTNRLLQMQIDAYISEKQLSDHERKEYRELASRITAYVAQLGEAQTQHDVSLFCP